MKIRFQSALPAALWLSFSVSSSALGGCSTDDGTGGTGQSGSTGVAGIGGSGTGNGGTAGGRGGAVGNGGSPAGGGNAGSGSGGASGSASGGSAGVSGSANGGSASGGSAGAGVAGSAGAGTGGNPGGGVGCPADATFCSGFEQNALPAGAVYKFNAAPGDWSRDFEVDTTLFRGGKSSLRVKSGSGDAGASGAYQMLAVPAPTGAFWVRLYIQQTEMDIGGLEHNVYGGAADSDEPNSGVLIELAEDVGVSFNTKDDVRWPMGFGRINGTPKPFTLPKGMWHCVEIHYDGAQRQQKLYINNALQIDAASYPATVASPIKVFKFGFNKLHGPPRKIWFDDVAVGPTRAGCL